MNSIYMNNFRGFNNTVVPILPVTFLVGENSTGKSSFLALAQLLSSPDFWLNLDFNAGTYEFGGYKDIVSVLSHDQAEFQIGTCEVSGGSREDKIFRLLHFCEDEEGLPALVRFSQLTKNLFTTIKINKNGISAAIATDLSACDNNSSEEACFAFLQKAATASHFDYKTLREDDVYFIRHSAIFGFREIISRLFDVKNILKENDPFPFRGFTRSFVSMAPIRTTPKRTYDGYTKRFSPEGEHTPYVIRELLAGGKDEMNPFKKALEAFGKDSGLFDAVGITQFGDDSASPFELTVTLSAKALRVNSVGYGVSQVLPVVVELLTRGNNSWFAIQQPEVHLHPKAQTALGDVLFHAAIDKAQTLLVETHSDYLIDRFRLAMRDHKHPSIAAQVIFFERIDAGNRICPMIIEDTGEYPVNQSPGFRNFFSCGAETHPGGITCALCLMYAPSPVCSRPPAKTMLSLSHSAIG